MITTTTASIFTAMVGLVGSVVGFYFGSKSEASSGRLECTPGVRHGNWGQFSTRRTDAQDEETAV